jgi:electron transport complex protein RnfB
MQENFSLVDQIEDLLPQTQCRQCGFSGCRPYAEAIAAGKANINQCPPGGQRGIKALAQVLGVDALPLNEHYGKEQERQTAVIVEQDCIGCTKCLPACPVDAIVGAARLMHTVIAAECTGCALCLEPCPVDCIILQPAPVADKSDEVKRQRSLLAKRRYLAKQQRKARDQAERARKRKAALGKMKATQIGKR